MEGFDMEPCMISALVYDGDIYAQTSIDINTGVSEKARETN